MLELQRLAQGTKNATGFAKGTYDRLFQDREPFLYRGRQASRISIPHLLPELGQQPSRYSPDLAETFQSIGARGVNNLSAKLLLALFPVNTKFFRLQVDKSSVVNLEQFQRERAEIEKSLAAIEDMILDEVEASGLRIKLYEALRQVVTTGNALLHIPQNHEPRVFRLDSYVVERDPRGNILNIVTYQRVSHLVLSEAVRNRVGSMTPDFTPSGMGASGDAFWDVYTIVRRMPDGTWQEWQEINGMVVDQVTTHQANRLPYIALRMYTTDGESYGRGHVEEYMGDLKALEGLREAMVDAALAASKVQPMVNPDGVTRIKTLRDAPNGHYISGRADDVTFLKLDKFPDLRVVATEIENLKRDLGLVFLLNSTVQRNAERVTAEEIRLVAQELEDTLGGTFSLLSADLQMPLVTNIIGRLEDRGAFPPLPDLVRPVIVTGLDAIGRGHDLAKMRELFDLMLQTFGPEAMRVVDASAAWQMAGTALGVDIESLLRSPEDLQAEQAQASFQEGMMKLGPEAMKQFPEEIRAAIAAQQGLPQAA